jgi:GDP-L-fucose synthase
MSWLKNMVSPHSITMNKSEKIYVAGHRGLVGSALIKVLREQGYDNLITRTHNELDLTNEKDVEVFFEQEKPDYVVLAAAKVGGINANNTYPAEFIFENLAIQSNVIHHAYLNKVKRLLFLGSSCIYPKNAPQPLKEEYLLTGALEETNRPYAIAKIAGIEMCWSYNRQYGTQFLSVMPTNLFGPGDNYDLNNSHVLPALLRKFHLAKLAYNSDVEGMKQDEGRYGVIPEPLRSSLFNCAEKQTIHAVEIWGTGEPHREFMYSYDMAKACIFLMNLPEEDYVKLTAKNRNDGEAPIINIGIGEDISIKDLAKLIAKVVGYEGSVIYDSKQPDGTFRKLMSISKLKELGWRNQFNLEERIEGLYKLYTLQEQG